MSEVTLELDPSSAAMFRTQNETSTLASPQSSLRLAGDVRIQVDLDTAGRMFNSGLMVLDDRTNVVSINRVATDLIDDCEVLRIVNGRLVVERAYVQRAVEELLKRIRISLAEDGFDPSRNDFIGVPDRSGTVRYALKVMSAVRTEGGAEFLVAVVDLIDRAAPSRSAFSSVFRLSEREAELAELFSKGLRLEEIARQMGVALNTARVHLRSIFVKTNCTGQLELMRMLTRLTGVIAVFQTFGALLIE
jgi:DNA-binding CsgD family transcriptional regulator